jgi:hypothetical protein
MYVHNHENYKALRVQVGTAEIFCCKNGVTYAQSVKLQVWAKSCGAGAENCSLESL